MTISERKMNRRSPRKLQPDMCIHPHGLSFLPTTLSAAAQLVLLLLCAVVAPPAAEANLLSHRAPLSAMAPGRFYFLSFPELGSTNGTDPSALATCGDGTAFSFAFKRGVGLDANRVVVEFGNGPACWDDGTCEVALEGLLEGVVGGEVVHPLRTPWEDARKAKGATGGVSLRSCSGLPAGMVARAVPVLFGAEVEVGAEEAAANASEAVGFGSAGLPLGARGSAGADASLGSIPNVTDSWSYLYIPHCTADLHIGMRLGFSQYTLRTSTSERTELVFHRGGVNALAVLQWLRNNIPNLDALVTTGCGAGGTAAPAVFAVRAAQLWGSRDGEGESGLPRRTYALSDSPFNPAALAVASVDKDGVLSGGPLAEWEPWNLLGLGGADEFADVPAAVKSLVRDNPSVRFGFYGLYDDAKTSELYAKLGTDARSAADGYDAWAIGMAEEFPLNFFQMSAQGGTACKFAFDELAESEEEWLEEVTRDWDGGDGDGDEAAATAAVEGNTVLSTPRNSGESQGFRPTFLFALAMTFVAFVLVWAGWHAVLWARSRRHKDEGSSDEGEGDGDRDSDENAERHERQCLSPLSLWLTMLTRYPGLFLVVSLAVPCVISWLGFEASNRAVNFNLDFGTYLAINTPEAAFDIDYEAAMTVQNERVKDFFEGDCKDLLNGPPPPSPSEDAESARRARRLKSPFPGKGRKLNLFYTSPLWTADRAADVFTQPALADMRSLEERIQRVRGFEDVCYQDPNGEGECAPLDSVVGRFFDEESGSFTGDVEGVLLGMIADGVVDHTDKFFSVSNLGSNFTRTSIYLRKGASIDFFVKLHQEVLWPADRAGQYPNVVVSWTGVLEVAEEEAKEALMHDAKWAAGTIIVVGLLVLLKVRNPFVFFMAMVGLVLSFPAAFYWYYVHFQIREIKVIQASALFVMLGIGADDIFLMVDAYAQTLVLLGPDAAPAERMKAAYRRAGGTMLVTTVTSAVCFYSNAFSVMLIVQEFGIFMGTVVLLNFFHVMTILPSSILVNDLYFAPFCRRVWERSCGRCKCPCLSPQQEEQEHQVEHVREEEEAAKQPDLFIEDDVRPSVVDKDLGPNRATSTTQHSFDTTENGDVEIGETAVVVAKTQEQREEMDRTVDVDRMNRLDRWLYSRYAPFIYRRRWLVILLSVVIAIVLGILAFNNFVVSDQGIILFQDEYNLGRVATIQNVYIKGYSQFKKDESASEAYAEIIKERKSESGSASTSSPTLTPSSSPATPEETPPISTPTSDGTAVPSFSPVKAAAPLATLTSPPGRPTRPEELTVAPSAASNPAFPIGARLTSAPTGKTPQAPLPTTENVAPTARSTPAPVVDQAPTGITFVPGPAATPSSIQEEVPIAPAPTPQPIDFPTKEPTVPQPTSASTTTRNEHFGTSGAPTAAPLRLAVLQPNPTPAVGTPSLSEPLPTLPVCSKPCWNGVCDAETSTCRCDFGFGGEACDSPICPSREEVECSPQGNCESRIVQCSGLGQCRLVDKSDGSKGESCVCDEGYTGADCSFELPTVFQLKETFEVSIVWGIQQDSKSFAGMWNMNGNSYDSVKGDGAPVGLQDVPLRSFFDLSDPDVQEWLWAVCQAARNPASNLNIRADYKSWIEIVKEEAEKKGLTFPLPKETFAGYISLLMENSMPFRRRFKDEIGVSGPGLGQNAVFASVSLLAEVPIDVGSDGDMASLRQWESFIYGINKNAPEKAGPAVAYSGAFKDVRREDAILSTTLSTWAIANGVCLIIILLFTRNIALSLIVMVTVVLLAVCLMGFILAVLAVDFGPIEAIGVTIFVGLSANYALHVAHAYHSTSSSDRMEKVQLTVFATASPILASAVSTIAGCAFLFGCRLWLFVELGMILCSNTAMALVFSMVFLLAVLSIVGPLPYEGHDNLHQCDFRALLSCKGFRQRQRADDNVPASSNTQAPTRDPSFDSEDVASLPLSGADDVASPSSTLALSHFRHSDDASGASEEKQENGSMTA